jgi:hypothetical protein
MRWTFSGHPGAIRLSQIRVIFQGARKSLSVAPSPSTRICKVAVGRFVTVTASIVSLFLSLDGGASCENRCRTGSLTNNANQCRRALVRFVWRVFRFCAFSDCGSGKTTG